MKTVQNTQNLHAAAVCSRRIGRVATAAVMGVALGVGAVAAGGTAANAATEPIPVGLDAPTGDAPGIAYLQGNTIHYPGGEAVEISKSAVVKDLAMIGENVAVVHGDDDAPRVDIYTPNGASVAGYNLESPSIAVDETNTLLAFVSVNSATVVLEDGGETASELPSAGVESPEVGAVEGSSAEDATVAINDGNSNNSFVVTGHGTTEEFAVGIRDISEEGEHLATLSIDEENFRSSSGVTTLGDVAWEQDGHGVKAYAPGDGSVLGGDSYADGPGDLTLGVLDASTGELTGAFQAEDVVFVDAVWEDSENVLVGVAPAGAAPDTQNVLRINTTTGAVETAVSGEQNVQIAD